MTDRNTDTNTEPPRPKKAYPKVILKVVIKGVSIAWYVYRACSKLLDLLKDFHG